MLQQQLPKASLIFKTVFILVTMPILFYTIHQNQSQIPELLSLTVIVSLGILTTIFTSSPMLPMLLSGIILRNTTPILPIPHTWTSIIWTTSLSAVICRAGLSLKSSTVIETLHQSGYLGLFPVLIESSFLTLTSHLIFDIPLKWGLIVGFGVGTISPGVVVPLILKISDSGNSRLSSLLTTALAIDVLIGTVGFGIGMVGCFGHVTHHDESWVVRIIEEIILGLGGALIIGGGGVLLARVKVLRVYIGMMLFVVSTVAMVICKSQGYIGAATALTFITWSIVGNYWSRELIEKSNEQ